MSNRRTIDRLTVVATTAVLIMAASASDQEVVTGAKMDPPEAGLTAPLWTPERPPNPHDTLAFVSLPDRFGPGRIRLSNANITIDPDEWRSVAFSDERNSEYCTLTLVGPRVALLAAHCVDAGRAPGHPGPHAVPATVRFGGNQYTLRCEIAPEYLIYSVNLMGAPRSTEDFALCDLDRDVTGVDAESISTTALLGPATSRVLLMGYGCTDLGLSESFHYTYTKGDQQLRMGDQVVEAVGISVYPNRPGIYVRVLSATQNEPVICFGDSGGPVMIGSSDGGGRLIVAVNSAVGATRTATPAAPSFFSYLAPLNSSSFIGFLRSWVDQRGIPRERRLARIVCGFNRPAGIGGCRG